MSTTGLSAWALPSPRQFLSEIETATWRGGAILALDDSAPPGLAGQISLLLREDFTIHQVEVFAKELPLSVLAKEVGCAPELGTFVRAEGQIVIVDGQGLSVAELGSWSVFMARFAKARAEAGEGVAVLFLGPAGFRSDNVERMEWARRFKRIDSLIWAEFSVPDARSGLFQDLAVNIAVELCGWRLDLIEDFVSQREEDILSPCGWLHRNADRASAFESEYGRRNFACPLSLFARGELQEIEQRVWRAQLSALFPWIEEQRLLIVDRYQKFLSVDDHLLSLRVQGVENIELGAMIYQLRRHLPRGEIEHIEDLAAMRNALAHRKPVEPQCFKRALMVCENR
jgi:hypothetical protein